MKHHKKLDLVADFFYMQELLLLHTKYRKEKVSTATHVEDRLKQTQLNVSGKVFVMYEDRGFEIRSLITDIEFECIREDIMPINLETVAVDDRVGYIEVSIRYVKKISDVLYRNYHSRGAPNS